MPQSNHVDDFLRSVGLHTALSPNACAAVSLDEQHLASLSSMHFEDEHTSDHIDEGLSAPQRCLQHADINSATRSDRPSLRDAVIGCFS